MKMNKYKINDLLLYILLFFGLFDTARNYTYLPVWFGYLKDVSIYALFLSVLINQKKVKLPGIKLCGFYFWLLSVLLFTPLGFVYSQLDIKIVLVACFKNIEFFLLIFIFFQWDKVFSISFSVFWEKYIYGAFFLCIVNIVGYWLPNPIVYRGISNGRLAEGFYVGRMTVGQPPVAIFPVLFSMIYLVFFPKSKKDFFLVVIYGICFLLALSMSGMVAFIIVIICYFFFYRNKVNSFYNKLILIIGSIVIAIAAKKLVDSNVFIYNAVNTVYDRLILYITSRSDASMSGREMHQKNALNTLEGLQWLFGRGEYGYFIKQDSINIENTYVRTLVTNGLIGLSSMLLFWGQLIGICVKNIRYDRNASLFMLLIIVVYLFHLYTLDFFLIYMLVFSFALFMTWMYRKLKI